MRQLAPLPLNMHIYAVSLSDCLRLGVRVVRPEVFELGEWETLRRQKAPTAAPAPLPLPPMPVPPAPLVPVVAEYVQSSSSCSNCCQE